MSETSPNIEMRREDIDRVRNKSSLCEKHLVFQTNMHKEKERSIFIYIKNIYGLIFFVMNLSKEKGKASFFNFS